MELAGTTAVFTFLRGSQDTANQSRRGILNFVDIGDSEQTGSVQPEEFLARFVSIWASNVCLEMKWSRTPTFAHDLVPSIGWRAQCQG